MRLSPRQAVSVRSFAPRGGREYARRLCVIVALALVGAGACSHGQNDQDDPFPRRLTVPIHVVNENYLDMDIAAVIGGVSRRVGDVPGNSSRNFTLTLSAAFGEPIVMTARPIGGNGSFTSSSLNIGMGQSVELRIGTLLRQSMAILHDSL